MDGIGGFSERVDEVADDVSRQSDRADGQTPGSVVFVSQQFPPDRSGHASRIRDLSTNLAAEGWEVSVLAPPPSFPPAEFDRSWRPHRREQFDGVTVHRLWTWQPSAADPGFLSRMAYYVLFAVHALLWLLVRGRDNDIVVTTTPPISTGLAGLSTVLFGQRWVVDVRDLWIDASVSLGFIAEGGVLERVSRRYQRVVLRTADCIAVTTATLGERLSEQYGDELEEKIRHVPNGVEISAFHSTARGDGGTAVDTGHAAIDAPEHGTAIDAEHATADAADHESADEQTPQVVIYTGNIGHAQALDTCIEALAGLPEHVVLRLVGGGDAVEALKREASDHGVRDRVEFLGSVPREQIPALLADAHVGIAPLKDDAELAYAMPTKVYEYLGCELPIVVTGRGELQRFVEDSGGGIHADNDPVAVASAIDTLLSDPELRARAGRRGYEHVARRYDRDRIAAQFSDELRRLLDIPSRSEAGTS